MAKSKAEDPKPATEGKPRRDRAAEAETQLRAYHALGRKVIARVNEGRLDADTIQELREETGYGFDNLRKSRVFATRYTAKQLDELCKLRTPGGMPLPWRHVRQLLMLPPGEGREALQTKAAERGWGLEELVAAIPKKVRRAQSRREGGRAFRRPKPWPRACGRSRGTATSGCGATAAGRGPATTGSKGGRVPRAPAA